MCDGEGSEGQHWNLQGPGPEEPLEESNVTSCTMPACPAQDGHWTPGTPSTSIFLATGSLWHPRKPACPGKRKCHGNKNEASDQGLYQAEGKEGPLKGAVPMAPVDFQLCLIFLS